MIMFTTGSSDTPAVDIALLSGAGNTGTENTTRRRFTGSSHTYAGPDMCEAPANDTDAAGRHHRPVGWLAEVEVTRLEPGKTYEAVHPRAPSSLPHARLES
jgi:hypothetical protein